MSVLARIDAHRRAVARDDANFDPQGVVLDQRAAMQTGVAEVLAFRKLISEPCLSLDDAQLKVDYIVNGTVPGRQPLVDCLDLYSRSRSLVDELLASLVVGSTCFALNTTKGFFRVERMDSERRATA